MPLDDRRLLLNGLQPTRLSLGSGGNPRPAKRQKTEGMNSRYDRMVQTVNVMHGYSSHSPRNGSTRRQRAVSSSSATGHEVSKTPVGAYHSRSEDRIGRSFSVLKVKASSAGDADVFTPGAFRDSSYVRPESGKGLPPWLRGTISSLNPKHPLRFLVPDHLESGPFRTSSPSTLDPSSDLLLTPGPEESPFAFTVPSSHVREDPRTTAQTRVIHDEEKRGLALEALTHDDPGYAWGTRRVDRFASPEPPTLPFSTPGPASTLGMMSSSTPALSLLPQRSSRPTPTNLRSPNATHLYAQDCSPPYVPFSLPGPLCSPAPLQPRLASALYLSDGALLDRYCEGSASAPNLSQTLLPQLHPQDSRGPRLTTPAFASGSSTIQLGPTVPGSASVSSPDMMRSYANTLKPYSTPGHIFLPRLASPVRFRSLTPPPAVCSPSPPVVDADCASFGFKWERFDRSNAPARVSSSPGRAIEGSEEIFWSQPTHSPLGSAGTSQKRTFHVNPSSPSVLAQRLPSPPAYSPAQRDGIMDSGALNDIDLRITPVSHYSGVGTGKSTPFSDLEEDNGPFAWIVPPRDQPPPSTPRRPVSTSQAGIGLVPPPKTISGGGCSSGVSNARLPGPPSSEAQPHHGAEDPPRPRGSPFAPASGIYISPLRGNDDAVVVDAPTNHPEDQPNGVKGPAQDEHPCEGSPKATPDQLSITATRSVQSSTKSSHAEDPLEEISEDGTGGSPHPKAHVTRGNGAASADVEIEDEDELQDYSQASKDTIESWTN